MYQEACFDSLSRVYLEQSPRNGTMGWDEKVKEKECSLGSETQDLERITKETEFCFIGSKNYSFF